MVGAYVDLAANSLNILDSQFEAAKGELGLGIVVNEGSMVRIEGNTLEGLAGPGIIANQVSALSVRENYFEGNNRGPSNFTFIDTAGARQSVCTDVLLNGDFCDSQCSTGDLDNSLSLAHFAAAASGGTAGGRARTLFGFAPAPIILNNHSPCRGVVVEANLMNAFCAPGVTYFGTFAAGATGLRVEANDCPHCGHGNMTCRAAGNTSGALPASLADAEVKLNTAHFA